MPPAPAARATRDRLIEAGRFLFWEKGYAATGLAEILARAEANSGSFYHFFESKDELLRTVLDTYLARLDEELLAPVRAAVADPLARVFALLAGYRRLLAETGCRYGCPIGRLALEIDAENVPAHRRIAANFSAWKRAVEAHLRAAGVRGPERVATLVLTVMEGAVMQARAYRSIEPFDASVRELRTYVESLVRRSRRRTPARRKRARP